MIAYRLHVAYVDKYTIQSYECREMTTLVTLSKAAKIEGGGKVYNPKVHFIPTICPFPPRYVRASL